MKDLAEDRKSALYGTLVTFLVLNNVAVVTRIIAHYRTYYRKGGWVFLEDIFLFFSGVSAIPFLNWAIEPSSPSSSFLSTPSSAIFWLVRRLLLACMGN